MCQVAGFNVTFLEPTSLGCGATLGPSTYSSGEATILFNVFSVSKRCFSKEAPEESAPDFAFAEATDLKDSIALRS